MATRTADDDAAGPAEAATRTAHVFGLSTATRSVAQADFHVLGFETAVRAEVGAQPALRRPVEEVVPAEHEGEQRERGQPGGSATARSNAWRATRTRDGPGPASAPYFFSVSPLVPPVRAVTSGDSRTSRCPSTRPPPEREHGQRDDQREDGGPRPGRPASPRVEGLTGAPSTPGRTGTGAATGRARSTARRRVQRVDRRGGGHPEQGERQAEQADQCAGSRSSTGPGGSSRSTDQYATLASPNGMMSTQSARMTPGERAA